MRHRISNVAGNLRRTAPGAELGFEIAKLHKEDPRSYGDDEEFIVPDSNRFGMISVVLPLICMAVFICYVAFLKITDISPMTGVSMTALSVTLVFLTLISPFAGIALIINGFVQACQKNGMLYIGLAFNVLMIIAMSTLIILAAYMGTPA